MTADTHQGSEHDDDAEPELTEVQKAYNVAQSEMFQLAAYGHHRYHPSGEALTDEGKRQQSDYLDRLRTAREDLEAATLRLVAEHAELYRGRPTADWLRSLADDGAELSLLAVRPDERDFDTEPVHGPDETKARVDALKADWARFRGYVLQEAWEALRDAEDGPLIDGMRVINKLMEKK
ncbi:hypothetical protein [Streptomyces sp. NPDC055105]|uniref:hypothetical protein n=1 Tax=Streptomyces sp. NPDC055105 TaxID=3365719 RepID=UPI0037CE1781